MLLSISIPNPSGIVATVEGSWIRHCPWDWNGKVSADKPIVALSFMRVGSVVEWARSEKGPKTELKVRLFLGHFDSQGRDVQASFSIGENGPRTRTLLSTLDSPPQTPKTFSTPLGRVFSFCKPFGEPQVELFGLVLLREQVTGARNGLWHLKARYCEPLTEPFASAFSYGRSGTFRLS